MASTAHHNLPPESQLDPRALRTPFVEAERKQPTFSVSYELMPYRLLDGGTVYYDRGVKPLILGLAAKHNVSPLLANHILIGVDLPTGRVRYGAGSQIRVELGPFQHLGELEQALWRWLDDLVPTAQGLGLGFTSLAFHPDRDPASIQIISKQRYPVMQRRFKTSGTRGFHVMTCAAGASVQLSAANEAEWVDKYRTALLAGPYLMALFANSPLERGKLQPVQSARALSWLDTDRARTAFFAQVFERDFGYDQYIDWALQVPALGIDRQGRAIDVGDVSFRDCLVSGKLYIGPDDWLGHLETLWPGVRFWGGVDLRLCDTNTPEAFLAMVAMVLGLTSDKGTRAEIQKRFAPQSDVARLPQKAARQGLFATSERGLLGDGAQALVALAKARLQGQDKAASKLLRPLERAVVERLSPADELRERFGRDWVDVPQLLTGTRVRGHFDTGLAK